MAKIKITLTKALSAIIKNESYRCCSWFEEDAFSAIQEDTPDIMGKIHSISILLL